MIANIPLLLVYLDYEDSFSPDEQVTVLAAALPGVGNPRIVLAEIRGLVARFDTLTCREVVDVLKEQGRIGGGTNPYDAYMVVRRELEEQITRAVLLTATVPVPVPVQPTAVAA